MNKREAPDLIIFFDGVCGLCNCFVDFVLKHDKRHIFSFAPLQGKTARELLPSKMLEEMNSIIFYLHGEIYEKSEGSLQVFKALEGIWGFFYIFKIAPRFLRDFIYDVVAKHRYQWFRKRETCRLPAPEEKAFFLD